MMKYRSKQSGFSLLELSVVLGVIALVLSMGLTIGDKKIEQKEIRSSWNELKVIKDALYAYGRLHGRLPCPAPLNAAKTDATYGLPAADCDATPTAGVTHIAAPAAKSGGVPFKVLGLSDAFVADDWNNRYVYVVDDAFISTMDSDDEGVLTVNDRGANVITNEAAFVVYSASKTGLGAVNHDTLTASACSASQMDRENCGGTAGTYMDSSIRETDADASYYDDLLVWGKRMNILAESPTIEPDEPEATCVAGSGTTFNGINSDDSSGTSVMTEAGDINGDGYMDIIIGAPNADPGGRSGAGETYVVFGKPADWEQVVELSTLAAGDGSTGFVLNGVSSQDASGSAVSSAGDINGDGYDDIIVGARAADPGGRNAAGEVYVVFGKKDGWAAELELSTLAGGDGSTGFVFNGIDASDSVGQAVARAGDINGDGYDDIVIGAYSAASSAGEAYVFFGKKEGYAAEFELSTLSIGDGSDGFMLKSDPSAGRAGYSVGAAGDVNGDG